MPFETAHALIIGVGSYAHQPEMNVPITTEDAMEVADVLRNSRYCGYPKGQVTLLTEGEATREKVEGLLDELALALTEQDTFLLFYSGHGEYGEDGYYLTTHDTRMSEGKVAVGTGVQERVLLEKLQAIKAKRVFLLFNACHSGEISTQSLGSEPEAAGRSLPERTATALLGTGEGRVIITACRESQLSYFEPKGELTYFAAAIADGLRGRGIESRKGYISIFDLYEAVFAAVSGVVKRRFGALGWLQEPELTIQKGVGAMAVALHRGKPVEGELNIGDGPPVLSGAVREVAAEDCERVLGQILRGEFTVGRDMAVVGRDQVDLRGSQGAIVNAGEGAVISQQFGNVTTVNTGSGDYAGRDLVKGDTVQKVTQRGKYNVNVGSAEGLRIGDGDDEGDT